jgi:hypothetical protein
MLVYHHGWKICANATKSAGYQSGIIYTLSSIQLFTRCTLFCFSSVSLLFFFILFFLFPFLSFSGKDR